MSPKIKPDSLTWIPLPYILLMIILDLQNMLQKLPNNIFEKSYPLREFDLQKRIHSFFYKAAEFCMVGLTAGAAQGALTNFAASKKKDR